MRDVLDIIDQDYKNGSTFELIELGFNEETHIIGSCHIPYDSAETKENIKFVFDNHNFESIEEFKQAIYLDTFDENSVIAVTKAGIINGEVLLKTPWGETRLARKAINIR